MKLHLLVNGINNRDIKSIQYFYDTYCSCIYGIAWQVTNSETLSDEILEEVMIFVMDKINNCEFKTASELELWVRRISSGLALIKVRKNNFLIEVNLNDKASTARVEIAV